MGVNQGHFRFPLKLHTSRREQLDYLTPTCGLLTSMQMDGIN